MPSSVGLSGTRLAWRPSGAWESVLMAPRLAKCWPGGTQRFRGPRTPMPGTPPSSEPSSRALRFLLLGPVRAAEHTAQPLVQRVADLVQRADLPYGGAVGRWQPVRLRVVKAAPDITDRDQLDQVGVDE